MKGLGVPARLYVSAVIAVALLAGKKAGDRRPASIIRAGFGLTLAAEHAEQRALAAAVEPDDADTVAVVEGERQIGEQRAIRAACPQTLRIDQNHTSGYGLAQLMAVETMRSPDGT